MKNILTKQGHKKLQRKLKKLNIERDRLVKDMEAARQEGDLSENSAYHNLRENLTIVRNQIGDLEKRLSDVEITEANGNGVVGVGNTVEVEVNGKTKQLEIVGDGEANPLKGRVSFQSPLGSSLVGHKKGQTVEVETPAGKNKYKIVAVN
jgi:transcription elongation factor GreA